VNCPACGRDIGHRPYEKDAKGKLGPVVTRCPNTNQVVTLDEKAAS
jgi:hypothetical protein